MAEKIALVSDAEAALNTTSELPSNKCITVAELNEMIRATRVWSDLIVRATANVNNLSYEYRNVSYQLVLEPNEDWDFGKTSDIGITPQSWSNIGTSTANKYFTINSGLTCAYLKYSPIITNLPVPHGALTIGTTTVKIHSETNASNMNNIQVKNGRFCLEVRLNFLAINIGDNDLWYDIQEMDPK